jgi:hypothetical protein
MSAEESALDPSATGQPLLCPACNVTWPPETVICVKCGLNLRTGARVWAPPPEPEVEPESAVERFATTFPGLFRPRTLIASIVAAGLAIVCEVLCVIMLTWGVFISAVSVGALGLVLYAQAVAWILAGELQLLLNAMVEFDGRRWNAFFIAVVAPVVLVLTFIGLTGKLAG